MIFLCFELSGSGSHSVLFYGWRFSRGLTCAAHPRWCAWRRSATCTAGTVFCHVTSRQPGSCSRERSGREGFDASFVSEGASSLSVRSPRVPGAVCVSPRTSRGVTSKVAVRRAEPGPTVSLAFIIFLATPAGCAPAPAVVGRCASSSVSRGFLCFAHFYRFVVFLLVKVLRFYLLDAVCSPRGNTAFHALTSLHVLYGGFDGSVPFTAVHFRACAWMPFIRTSFPESRHRDG